MIQKFNKLSRKKKIVVFIIVGGCILGAIGIGVLVKMYVFPQKSETPTKKTELTPSNQGSFVDFKKTHSETEIPTKSIIKSTKQPEVEEKVKGGVDSSDAQKQGKVNETKAKTQEAKSAKLKATHQKQDNNRANSGHSPKLQKTFKEAATFSVVKTDSIDASSAATSSKEPEKKNNAVTRVVTQNVNIKGDEGKPEEKEKVAQVGDVKSDEEEPEGKDVVAQVKVVKGNIEQFEEKQKPETVNSETRGDKAKVPPSPPSSPPPEILTQKELERKKQALKAGAGSTSTAQANLTNDAEDKDGERKQLTTDNEAVGDSSGSDSSSDEEVGDSSSEDEGQENEEQENEEQENGDQENGEQTSGKEQEDNKNVLAMTLGKLRQSIKGKSKKKKKGEKKKEDSRK